MFQCNNVIQQLSEFILQLYSKTNKKMCIHIASMHKYLHAKHSLYHPFLLVELHLNAQNF